MTLRAARRAVDRERRECVAEREAFRSFRRAVARLDESAAVATESPASLGADVGSRLTPTGRLGGSGGPTSRRPVADAYRRSVLAVDHVDADSVMEHMAAELGPDLARLAVDGPVAPDERGALLDRIDIALEARQSFVAMLDRETDSIEAVDAACSRLQSRIDRVRAWESTPAGGVALEAAFEAWAELDRIATGLDEAATDRQATLARHRRSFAAGDAEVTEYLYGGRPGLAAVASVGRDVAAGREAVVDAVGRPR
ncbi:DUF7260 family protein [Salinigranum salinum]|uniref:DUF7260 family protein n=1 Tax=Salinigranum salinum TaxID=1364937 RepID=UPI0012604782|nr:hypothetical protein [Salinigranum salinum]